MLESEWKAFVASRTWNKNFTKTDYSYRAADIEGLRKGFEKPPMEAGPWVYWFCFDNAITKQEMEREIKEMVSVGIAGAELRFVEFAWWRKKETVDKELELAGHKRLEYLSDEFVDVLEHACSVAQRHGFKLSINMGMGWPPGGTWITEEYRTRKLDEEKEKCVLAGSFIDLSSHVRITGEEGSLFWRVPEGRWLIGVFWLGYGGGLDKAYGYPADPGSKEAIEFHLKYLFAKIGPKLGWEYDGRPYWTPGMDEMFAKLHGYQLAPRMYALAGYGDDREKILADVERAEQKLVMENFFICAREVLNAHGLGHRPQAYGRGLSRDLFEAYSNCDVPEIEEGVYCPEAIWASHTLGKPITSVEGMTFMSRHVNNVIDPVFGDEQKGYGIDEPRGSWETNPAMLRWFSNAHYARGINRVQMHSFGYSPDGVPLPGWRMYAEIHLNRNVPWWRYMKQYSAWSRRTQWVLQSGWPVADSLVYPVQGDRGDGPHNKRADQQPVSAMNCIDAADTYTFGRIWESDDNRYEVKHLCLLGDIKTLKEADKIDRMIKKGVKVTYCGVEPDKWTVFRVHKGPVVEALSQSIEKARRQGRMVDGRKEGFKRVLKKARSVRWYPEDAVLTYLHRRVEGAELYFVMNCAEEFNGELEFSETGLIPEIWDADTGKKTVCGQWRL
ncbi:MAG: glycosyl hydrolase, partial [Planctomycetota bacterium]